MEPQRKGHNIIDFSMIQRSDIIGQFSYSVEPPNKGYVGDNINSAVVSFAEMY